MPKPEKLKTVSFDKSIRIEIEKSLQMPEFKTRYSMNAMAD
ncbi:hypothetical protein VCHENC03_2969 [Vibrio sp. HENC-03]|nr:hypothetical protein VCHENC03_2969 [Vibrio sp. HENC-03]